MRLIDADALAKLFRDMSYDEWNSKTGTSWEKAFEAAEEYVDEQPTIDPSEMQWIYVDDEYPDGNLPNIGEPVLLCCEIYLKNPKVSVCHYMEIGTYEWDGEQNTGMWFVGDKQVSVSHWMPLPTFPEGYGR